MNEKENVVISVLETRRICSGNRLLLAQQQTSEEHELDK